MDPVSAALMRADAEFATAPAELSGQVRQAGYRGIHVQDAGTVAISAPFAC
jgi:hypothetical protein